MPKYKDYKMGADSVQVQSWMDDFNSKHLNKTDKRDEDEMSSSERRRMNTRVRAPAQSGMSLDEVKKSKSRTR